MGKKEHGYKEHGYKEPSIQSCLIKNIILYVLMPLFVALTCLCLLLQRNLTTTTTEAFQMMFNQNVKGIDSAVLQSNYSSSTMITYSENIKLLHAYSEAKSEYEKFAVITQLQKMLGNCEIISLDSFRGQMVLLMNDGRMIASNKTRNFLRELNNCEWWEKLQNSDSAGVKLYWDNEMDILFEQNIMCDYLVFGRALRRYREAPLGYAIVRIPRNIFFQFSSDSRFQMGTLGMLSPDGEMIATEGGNQTEKTMQEIFAYWKSKGENTGRYHGKFYMASRLDSCNNVVLYVADINEVFAQNKIILFSIASAMAVIGVAMLLVVIYIAEYVSRPVLSFAERSGYIEQGDPQKLVLTKHHYKETKVLEDAMIRAQKRIGVLVEEVRQETEMKEKARYDALRAQITPHFLFNTLNAIRWKASLNHDEEVADILSELGLLLGESYQNTDEMETIGSAMEILDAYVKIMQVRFGDKVKFFFMIPEESKVFLIPRFCLQPLVENSFIHGMGRRKEGVIVLRAVMTGDDIIFTLTDNGSGLNGKQIDLTRSDEPKMHGVSGIGLPNIHGRIQRLFGKKYGLSIDETVEMGFKISLKIPVCKEKDRRIDK